MTAASPLSDLLLALFKSGSELRRFLTLAGFDAVEHRLPVTKGDSIRGLAADAAAALEDLGLVGPALFEALLKRAPERAEDIRQVARAYEVVPGASSAAASSEEPALAAAPPSDGQDGTPLSAEFAARYAKFVEELDAELAAPAPPDPAEAAMSAERWPWTGAAAVLGGFPPLTLQPLPKRKLAAGESGLTALAEVVYTSSQGRWVLDGTLRSRALRKLVDDDSLEEAINANLELADEHRDWLRRVVSDEFLPPLASLETRELQVLDTVTRWLEPFDLELDVERAHIYAATERRVLIEPLRLLVGSHFRGRAAELERIERHIRGEGDKVLAIFGPGGSGKSSLVGKILLELEDEIAYQPLSFAYVDFDKARHDPRDPRGLVEQIARQLRLLYAAHVQTGRELSGIESAAAGTDLDLAAEVLQLDSASAALGVDALIKELATRLNQIPRAYPTSLLLILDTLEEVQLQGLGAITDTLELIAKFRAVLPSLRVIVAGRGDLNQFVGNDVKQTIELGDLDPDSADAVLESRGIAAAEIRKLIYEQFGGNPLTLRLAAEALQRLGSAEKAFGGVLEQADALAAVGREQIQGMLYDRILGHIGDPEVVRVAQPGLAVRRVDSDVIREVLAGPCKLDPNRADAIFERLQREVSMFEVDADGALRHRQDVRRLMLRSMTRDPKVTETIAEIHRLAVAYYAKLGGNVARAEEIYHRLMTSEDPRSVEPLWDSRLRQSLFPALEDPLPPAAKQWLRRRLGLVDDEEERAGWDQQDWEVEAADRANSWLASGQPQKALEVLSERERRLPGSRLFALDVAALIDLNRFNEAEETLGRGLQSAIEAQAVDSQLELAEQAIKLATKKKDATQIVAATESALRLCDLKDEQLRGLNELTGAVEALEEMGASDQAGHLGETISSRFSLLSAETLRENPLLVRNVMQAVGSTDSAVLTQAALMLGDVTSEEESLFRDDPFTLGRLLELTSPEGKAAMNELAVEVGLPEGEWTTQELATSAVRFGRTGKAVAVALDHATEESTARELVVGELVRPATSVQFA